jgi:hypothetical protein
MRRVLAVATLAIALLVPVAATAADEWYNPSAGVAGTPQQAALAAPDAFYIAPGFGQAGEQLPGFTPNTARAWWDAWFAHPWDLRLADPAALPGSLVLTAEQGARAVALNKTVLPVPPAGVPKNPNLYAGSPTLTVIQNLQAAGHPSFPPFAPGVTFGPTGWTFVTAPVLAARAPDTGVVARLRHYIAVLSAVRHPSASQRDRLGIYRLRLARLTGG